MAILGYVFFRTQSRGGLLCLLAGGSVLLHDRIGTRKTIAAAVLVVPVLLIAARGRMTDLSAIESGTGQSRVQLWSGALTMFKEDPLFGSGYGTFVGRVGEAAHNSFVHCYAELGFLGGTLFMGAFGCAIWMLARARHPSSGTADYAELTSDQREMLRLRPFLLAAAVAYAVGMLSLSRAYVVPTYMILGLSTAWLRTVGRQLELPRFVFNLQFARHLATAGVLFLAATYGFIQVFLRW
jgi:O-antigen ligase